MRQRNRPNQRLRRGFGQASRSGEASRGLFAVERGIWSTIAGSVALIGLILYGMLRFSYDLFYKPFGLGLGDLEIGYGELLAESAVGFVVLLLAFAIVWAPSVLLWSIFVRKAWNSSRNFRERLRDSKAGKALGATYLVVLLVGFFGPFELLRWFAALALLVTPLVATAGILWNEYGPDLGPRARRMGHHGRTYVIATITTLVFAFAAMVTAAVSDSEAVRSGETRLALFLGGRIRLTSWGGQRALLTPITEEGKVMASALAGHKVMYLGVGKGHVLLFDATSQRTVRLPVNNVTIETEVVK